MAPARKRTTNIARRRRTDDEDESQSVATLADDSQSDASVLSDVDEDADADNSDLSEVDSAPSLTQGKPKRKSNGPRDAKPRQNASQRQPSPPIARSDVAFSAIKETEIMMNGLQVGEDGKEPDEVDFETGTAAPETAPAAQRIKQELDTDIYHSMRPQPSEATDSPWQHDLHETVNAPGSHDQPGPPPAASQQQPPNAPAFASRVPPGSNQKPSQARNFSTTVHTHNAMVRVFLPNMKGPIQFQNVPIKQHTRLPNHRPPLRRDKPVRISLPPAPPRYIFPTVERSFIFIPRALRPNQQGFGRGRGRFGSFGGGFSSRRTSAYGGSVYSPSVAMSRRSSIAREIGRENLVSPAGSIMSRNGGFVDPSRPVVRLPPGGPRMSTGPSMISPTNGAVQPPYPLPQKPAFRENWQGQLPIHQPRPQKTVSVAGIESPASLSFNPPQQQEQQPFHQQVPAHINGAAPAPDQSFYQHGRHASYPSQVSTGTPLNNIPERAIHAPAFQPYAQPGFQPQAFVPQGYYYPQNTTQPQYMAPAGMVPMFVPGTQQPGYVMPVSAPPVAAPPAPAGQPNMVAYESNGMTYYVDSAQLYPAPPAENYAQPNYAVPGMGGMMTPGPDGAYYYPQQMQPAGYYPQQ
ncbi:hypothetical protein GGP41_001758 [Bipolaris sorokiniana]|uniref:Btz domain-containing protein n=1 Tax=Cochliobolus sativus TaxID=45130 RepID=A0A8H5ZPI1_COCSA|nr:hypothetical protein GGP41_001758 [Bipolaris sorokiniana]